MTVPKKKPVYVSKKLLPATDPKWKEMTEPLLEYLTHERSWGELISWGKKERVPLDTVRNMLAWLSLQGLATYKVGQKLWTKV